MKKVLNIIIFLTIVFLIIFFFILPKQEMVSKNLFYMDTYIEVKIYSRNKAKAIKALEEVNNIYKTYNNLSDRFTTYNELNVYDINNHTIDSEYLTIDEKLYNLINFGLQWYQKSNHLLDINMGGVINVWKKYQQNKNGIPSKEELELNINYNEIKLLDNNKILNNKPNIDLGAIAKGYATEEASKYLKNIGLNKFLINAGGNVVVGDHYDKGIYKIGIENPNDNTSIYQIVKGNNISVVTSGGYQRYYEYEGVRYNHIIDPNTLMPSNNMKSVTVITKDSAIGDALSTTLFLMSVEDGQEFLKQYDAEAIWYTNDDKIIKSEGFSKYE